MLSSEQSNSFFLDSNAQLVIWQDRLRGIGLLQECPDGIRAEIVVAGERLSAALMEQVMI